MDTHGNLHIKSFVEPQLGENGFLLWREGETDCWIVDPGLPPEQPQRLAEAVTKQGLTPRAILVTHGHFDHIGGITTIREELGDVPIVCPEGDAQLLVDPMENLCFMLGCSVVAPEADQLIKPGDTLALADLEWRVLDVSGHSPGGAAYYCEEAGVVLGGDSIFYLGIGRTDFHHSDPERFYNNLLNNLLSLPEETVLYPGHGEEFTIGFARMHNAMLREVLDR